MFKRSFVSGLVAICVATGALAGTVQPSSAHGFHKHHHHKHFKHHCYKYYGYHCHKHHKHKHYKHKHYKHGKLVIVFGGW